MSETQDLIWNEISPGYHRTLDNRYSLEHRHWPGRPSYWAIVDEHNGGLLVEAATSADALFELDLLNWNP